MKPKTTLLLLGILLLPSLILAARAVLARPRGRRRRVTSPPRPLAPTATLRTRPPTPPPAGHQPPAPATRERVTAGEVLWAIERVGLKRRADAPRAAVRNRPRGGAAPTARPRGR
jgi:hypothetical protein